MIKKEDIVHSWKIQYDQNGQFRIVKVLDTPSATEIASPWVGYRSIASLTHEGSTYIAVSAYYEGMIPHEQVMYVNPQPTTLQEVDSRTSFRRTSRFFRSILARIKDESGQEHVVVDPIVGELSAVDE
jgi:hypothetical protein